MKISSPLKTAYAFALKTDIGFLWQVLIRSAISTIYEPSIKSILMDSTRTRKKEQIGSLAGLQQTMKGAAQVFDSSVDSSTDGAMPGNQI